MLVSVAAMAQVESGKVYRIVNKMYGTVAYESVGDHNAYCAASGSDTDYNQMWIITESNVDSYYTFQNVYTGRYLNFQQSTNVPFYTTTTKAYMYINDNSYNFSGCYSITGTKSSGWGMHCASSGTCVPWNTNAEATNWTFAEVDITAEEIAEARAIYAEFNNIVESSSQIAAKFENLFEDKACTVLKAEYAAMSDDEIAAALEGIPADLIDVALKVKNNSWNETKREKEFRIYDYKPYSNPEKWANKLYLRLYSPIDNPTGICSNNDKGFIYVFVDEIPDGAVFELDEIRETHYFGTSTRLHQGLNIVPSSLKDGFLYVSYICDTDINGKKLADYPAVKVHIENGSVHGFWSTERGHTNADWKYMQQNMFENGGAIQVKGKYSLLSFRKKEFLQHCPTKIEELINLWDFWNETQQNLMNLPKYYDWFNNLQLAMTDDTGFMDAGNWRTHYNNNTLNTIANYDLLVEDAGSTWGPNHEIGHNNQYVIEIVGTSEVSNNAFANMVTYYQGTHTSRGQNMKTCINSFESKIPYVLRGEKEYGQQLFSMTRMYFQLFLYAHAAGKCPTFYQQLHERLRYDRLVGWGVGSSDELDENGFYRNSVNALNDQLKFAEACCDILQMDLSEFFEAWGFFIPFKNGFVGDYGHHWVYLLEEDVKASKARMQQYEKKGGHLIFLEDRIRPYERLDGKGNRASYADWAGERVGDVGKVGQWQDFIDESVKAQGYYFTKTNGKIVIKGDATASGALGFKLYNADTNELLTFTNGIESMGNDNWASMTIPMAATGAKLRVVAAQADGTDYIIPSAAEGPEDMQLEALKTSLTMVSALLNNTSTKGNEVGKYYADMVVELQTMYDKANAAYNNKDASEHSFADWSAILDEEYNKVVTNDKTRLLMREGNKYYMYNAGKTAYYFTNSAGKIIGEKSNSTNGTYTNDADKHWELIYSGEPGFYFLKSESGYYVAGITAAGEVYTLLSRQSAAKFQVNYTANGRTYFTIEGNEANAIGFDNSSNPVGVGINPTETRGQWQVRLLEDNSAEFESNELTSLMNQSEFILTEITDVVANEKNDTVYINKNIKANDITLQDNIKSLYNAYMAVNMENTSEYIYYIRDLRQALYDIEGKYTVVGPAESTKEHIMWYAIRSTVTGMLWNVPTSTQLNLLAEPSTGIPAEMMWAVLPTGTEGVYKLMNAATETAVYRYIRNNKPQNSYCVADRTASALPISFIAQEDGSSLIQTGNGVYATDNGTSAIIQYNTKGGSGWTFELVSIEKNEELFEQLTEIEEVVVEGNEVKANAGIYDIFGRKITTPAKNTIYIKDGQKFFNK